jgi:hypothetical protein
MLPVLAFVLWRIALPTATVHYSGEGQKDLRYVWNVQDQTYKGQVSPGGRVSDKGVFSPDDEFFMEFSWQSENSRWHCISITPRWPNTDIFLDADGNIDMRRGSGTDVDRLKICEWDQAKP